MEIEMENYCSEKCMKNDKKDRYVLNGYKDRKDYLEMLADENGIDYDTVSMLAEMLGENEDFDGLVTSIEDMDF